MSIADSYSRPPALPAKRGLGRLRAFKNIIWALVLHDIKNRFFGSGLGQVVMVIWPFVHILVLVGIFYFTKRPYPYGDGAIQYSAVSIFPYVIFNYVSRWIVFSASTNKSFLQYPIVKPLDLLIARTVLETVSITLVGILLLLFLAVADSRIMPADILNAIYAVLGTLFLSIGWGFLNAPISFVFPIWMLVVTLFMILTYISSGILFVASTLPEQARYPLSFNPVLHCVEWFRVAYYNDYPTEVLDRLYVVECGLGMLTMGLILNFLLKRFY